MNFLTEILYVEGDLILTLCNIFSCLVAVEFIGLVVGYLGKIGR